MNLIPNYLSLNQIKWFERRIYHRTHPANMRKDRLAKLVKADLFTIFVLGTGRTSMPIIVSKSTTAAEVLETIWLRGYLPTNYHVSHMLATLGRSPKLLVGSATMAQLGIGALSHLQLRIRLPGGSNSDSDSDASPRTPEPSSSRRNFTDSPSKNTRSQTKIARDDVPVVQSPPKPRKAKDKDVEKTDKAVWHLTDDEIIAASRKSWKSAVYDHYTVSLERQLDKDSNPHCLIFLFTCRFDPKNHNVQRRKRIQNSQGTSNLARTMKTCCESRKVEVGADSSKGAQQDLHRSVSRFAPAIQLRNRPVVSGGG
ncbi:hypothetical protein R3P38DRAFT_1887871 [Favolaschia claudopus]|uniref:Uncharacterized protein n=1 Tax=Favolaschia claudopus TaxID=2862362 RepID=A0AAW0A1P9_9AGAR